MRILCQDSGAASPNMLTNCGRAEMAAGNAALSLHDPNAAEATLRKAEAIASAKSHKDPQNAVFRSDAARSEAALAAALNQAGDPAAAKSMYGASMRNWARLRDAKSITAEDGHRSQDAAAALASLASR